MVDGAAVEREGGERGSLREVADEIRPGGVHELRDRRRRPSFEHRSEPPANLLFAVGCSEVEVEVALGGRGPLECPTHPLLVSLELLERSARDVEHGDVTRLDVGERGVDRVRTRRAHRAPGLVGRPEHEVIDEQLRSAVEQLGERLGALVGLKPILLLHRHPRQIASLARELVAEACQLLFSRQQRLPGSEPLFASSNLMIGHGDASCGVGGFGKAGSQSENPPSRGESR